jgi:hypothetical protein
VSDEANESNTSTTGVLFPSRAPKLWEKPAMPIESSLWWETGGVSEGREGRRVWMREDERDVVHPDLDVQNDVVCGACVYLGIPDCFHLHRTRVKLR